MTIRFAEDIPRNLCATQTHAGDKMRYSLWFEQSNSSALCLALQLTTVASKQTASTASKVWKRNWQCRVIAAQPFGHTIAKGQFWRVNCDHVRHRRAFNANPNLLFSFSIECAYSAPTKNAHYRIIDCKRAAVGLSRCKKQKKLWSKFIVWRKQSIRRFCILLLSAVMRCVCALAIVPTNRFELTFQAKVINSPSFVWNERRSYCDLSLRPISFCNWKFSNRINKVRTE